MNLVDGLTDDHTQAVHVRLPVGASYDIKDPHPMNTLQIRKSNVAMWIREDLKHQIQDIIEGNSEYVSCTDIDRLLLMVEEMKITCLPLQGHGDAAGNVDRKATPLILNRNSDLSGIFKDHVAYTTMIQLCQRSNGPITFNEEFVYSFKVDASCITMPRLVDGKIDADEISSPRIAGLKSQISDIGTAQKGVIHTFRRHGARHT